MKRSSIASAGSDPAGPNAPLATLQPTPADDDDPLSLAWPAAGANTVSAAIAEWPTLSIAVTVMVWLPSIPFEVPLVGRRVGRRLEPLRRDVDLHLRQIAVVADVEPH